ncbi:MAG TPA: SDR family oxidoreductase [Hyphomicrobium sp.]|nr:SDR family oxidoreductase [Hyphomicrobium sp.]
MLVLGASGGVGSCLLEQAVARGHHVTAQTRSPDKLTAGEAVSVVVGSPTDEAFLRRHVVGHDAVVLCLGVAGIGRTTLFSESTKAVIGAMTAAGVRRLIAVTGVGAGESKGHGGWFYNAVVYPLFTRNRYADKDRQEAIIAESDLEWTIVRPAPFTAKAGAGAWQVYTEIPDALQLTSVTRAEVASFILDSLETASFVHQKPFIGHS